MVSHQLVSMSGMCVCVSLIHIICVNETVQRYNQMVKTLHFMRPELCCSLFALVASRLRWVFDRYMHNVIRAIVTSEGVSFLSKNEQCAIATPSHWPIPAVTGGRSIGALLSSFPPKTENLRSSSSRLPCKLHYFFLS